MAHLTTRDMRGNEARDSLLTEMRSENQHCERGMPITSAQSARPCRYAGPGVISVKERRRPRRLGPAYTHSHQARATHHALDHNGQVECPQLDSGSCNLDAPDDQR